MIAIIDNFDSFTYNLYQYIGEIIPDIRVFRNNKISVKELGEMKPSHIIISPGPGYPQGAGISINVIRELGKHIPTLGVCLGHQAIGENFGGRIVRAKELMHGKSSNIKILKECRLFEGLEAAFTAGRYHSLIVDKRSIEDNADTGLEITAVSEQGEIMALRHKEYPVFGIQFHPESILTPVGKRILENFLKVS